MRYGLANWVYSALVGLLIVVLSAWWTMVEGQAPFLSPRSENPPEGEMVKFLEQRFQKFTVPLSFGDSVGVVVMPIKSVISVTDLMQKGVGTVGGLYVPTGSVRLNLKPGAYTVDVVREEGRWVARLKDVAGGVNSKVSATIILGPSRARVLTSVERSICWEINGGIVCI